MFNNVGSKIKLVARVVCWVGIVAAVLSGLIFMLNAAHGMGILGGLLIMLLGALGSWISSLLIYGFGQLVENSDVLALRAFRMEKTLKAPEVCENTPEQMVVPETENTVSKLENTLCPHCGGRISAAKDTASAVCPWCNEKIVF